MENIHVLIQKASDDSSVSGGSWRSSAPLSNVQNKDVRRVARSTNAATASTVMRFDGGDSPKQSWSMFAILNHSITTTGKWRVVLTDSDTDVVEQRIYDSGLIDVWEATIIFGSRPWGLFPWNGVDVNDYPTYPIAFHVSPESYYARYLFLYIEDAANPAGYVDVGRVLAGEAWRPNINPNYGFSIRYVDPSEIKRTRGGHRITSELPRYRVLDMEFTGLSESEALGAIFEWQKVGRGNDVLFVKNPLESAAIRFRSTLYCAMIDTQPIPELFQDRYATRLSLEELI